jgi:hypothetical protein
MREKFVLPDKRVTTDVDEYVSSWRSLAKIIADATNSRTFAFDPDIALISSRNETYYIPADVAILLAEAIRKANEE